MFPKVRLYFIKNAPATIPPPEHLSYRDLSSKSSVHLSAHLSDSLLVECCDETTLQKQEYIEVLDVTDNLVVLDILSADLCHVIVDSRVLRYASLTE